VPPIAAFRTPKKRNLLFITIVRYANPHFASFACGGFPAKVASVKYQTWGYGRTQHIPIRRCARTSGDEVLVW